MKLTKEQVEHIADLSRLEISEEEKAKFANELSAILNYVSELNQVNTENVSLNSQAAGSANKMREDKTEKFGREKELIAMAPEHQGGCVKTKAIL
ncbi:Asp-tRNA(Asn)/Glu-tRNA(Gln) amidotransferase GatCAB subunit C [bacterium (Candidatus Torokbacteria) CG09_land_8_20_14_0_10_42_11]|nr:MAG: Asp-tRNA(Asn)/Glu-tRNA(Gln) amidotransferase GatCAB subunit C [bacterium (Candidatus Torokbacteria) CG09_land_8_20_14_0_10_42_11]